MLGGTDTRLWHFAVAVFYTCVTLKVYLSEKFSIIIQQSQAMK